MKILVIILAVISLNSCANVTQDVWKAAERLCSRNGGIKNLYVSITDMELYCNNGSVFAGSVIRINMKRYLTKL